MHESSDIIIKHEMLVAKIQFHSNSRASGTEQGSVPTRSRTQKQALLAWCPPRLISNGKCMPLEEQLDLYFPGKGGGGGFSWEFLVGGVLPGSLNPNPISYQKMKFSTPVFRPYPLPSGRNYVIFT